MELLSYNTTLKLFVKNCTLRCAAFKHLSTRIEGDSRGESMHPPESMMVSLLECVSKGGSSRAAKQAQHTASFCEILIQFCFYEKAKSAPSDLQLPLR